MQWFKRQPCLIKAFMVGFGVPASLFACFIVWALTTPNTSEPGPASKYAREYETVAAERNATRAAGTPTPQPMGLSRLSPAAMGEPVVADNDIELTVLGLERDAWPTIYEANMFNPAPEEGMEYVIVTIQARNLGDSAKTVRVGGLDFRMVGARGTIYDRRMVMLGSELDVELFGGGIAEGRIPFQVVQGEKELVLIYDSGLDTKARYLCVIGELRDAEPTATVVPTPTPGAWYEIARWTGTSDKNTEVFHIPSHEWRISWEVGEGAFGTVFGIIVYDAAGNFVDSGGVIMEPGQDSTIVRGAGDYYLSISAMQPYTVVIEARQGS